MKKLYAIITKDRPEAFVPRTTAAIYTSRKKAEEIINALRARNSDIIWDIQEWHETLTGEYIPQNI